MEDIRLRIVLQRVSRAHVVVSGDMSDIRGIGAGIVALVGFCDSDDDKTLCFMANKLVNLRIFNDEGGNMNRSLLDVDGELLVVSQFTLYANSRKGRRPSFIEAAGPDIAIPLYERFIEELQSLTPAVKCGEFGADMKVELINDGPVTIILDSSEIMSKQNS